MTARGTATRPPPILPTTPHPASNARNFLPQPPPTAPQTGGSRRLFPPRTPPRSPPPQQYPPILGEATKAFRREFAKVRPFYRTPSTLIDYYDRAHLMLDNASAATLI